MRQCTSGDHSTTRPATYRASSPCVPSDGPPTPLRSILSWLLNTEGIREGVSHSLSHPAQSHPKPHRSRDANSASPHKPLPGTLYSASPRAKQPDAVYVL